MPPELVPDPSAIRARLSELWAEREYLRALLRLLERRECGRELLRRRREQTRALPEEARHE